MLKHALKFRRGTIRYFSSSSSLLLLRLFLLLLLEGPGWPWTGHGALPPGPILPKMNFTRLRAQFSQATVELEFGPLLPKYFTRQGPISRGICGTKKWPKASRGRFLNLGPCFQNISWDRVQFPEASVELQIGPKASRRRFFDVFLVGESRNLTLRFLNCS